MASDIFTLEVDFLSVLSQGLSSGCDGRPGSSDPCRGPSRHHYPSLPPRASGHRLAPFSCDGRDLEDAIMARMTGALQ